MKKSYLIKPTKEQIETIKEFAIGGRYNYYRDWILKKRIKMHHKELEKICDLTEEQFEYIQARRLIERMTK